MRVLFLCHANAARSQMAEALFRQLSNGRADVFSAGGSPGAEVLPQARAVLWEKFAIETSALHPKPLRDLLGQRFDFVITLCDEAAELCPLFPGVSERIHWNFEDPARAPDDASGRLACERVASGLAARLRLWMSLPEIHDRLEQADHFRKISR